jgi:Lipocalin-like domain
VKEVKKTLVLWVVAFVVSLNGPVHAQSSQEKESARVSYKARVSDKERLTGAWHLVSIGEARAGGNADIKGTLIYTRDGHMSVQLMYPPSQASLSNDYVLNGYEASFGSYEVNEETHTVTHHVQGSITRGLVGKSLPRVYELSKGQLIIRPAGPDEHWSVIWEHD